MLARCLLSALTCRSWQARLTATCSPFWTLAKDATATILQSRHSVTRFPKADVKKAKAAEADAAVVANVSEAQLV